MSLFDDLFMDSAMVKANVYNTSLFGRNISGVIKLSLYIEGIHQCKCMQIHSNFEWFGTLISAFLSKTMEKWRF